MPRIRKTPFQVQKFRVQRQKEIANEKRAHKEATMLYDVEKKKQDGTVT